MLPKAPFGLFVTLSKSAISNQDKILRMLNNGATGFRLIAKGYTPSEFKSEVEYLFGIKNKIKNFKLIIDFPGSKPRLSRNLQSTKIQKKDLIFFNTTSKIEREPKFCQFDTELLHLYRKNLQKGHRFLIADGSIILRIIEITKAGIVCVALTDGIITPGRSINLPDSKVSYNSLTNVDKKCLETLESFNLDFICLSMVCSSKDVIKVKKILKKKNINGAVISKIETVNGLLNLDEIMKVSDDIMIGRGDLSIETPIDMLGVYQEYILQACDRNRKNIILATGLFSSLSHQREPLISEVSEFNFFLQRGVSNFLLGDVIAEKKPEIALKWISKCYDNWINFKKNDYFL